MARVAVASSRHELEKTFATLSLNSRPRDWHTARNTSLSVLTAPRAMSPSILCSAASRCIQFLLYRHAAAYSPNASTTGVASAVSDAALGSGGGRSALTPSGTSPGPNRDPPSPFPRGAAPPPSPPGNSSSIPEGTRDTPVARAATSSLFPPTEEGSNAPGTPPGTPSSRKRVGVPENAVSAAAALETAKVVVRPVVLCAWKSLPTGARRPARRCPGSSRAERGLGPDPQPARTRADPFDPFECETCATACSAPSRGTRRSPTPTARRARTPLGPSRAGTPPRPPRGRTRWTSRKATAGGGSPSKPPVTVSVLGSRS